MDSINDILGKLSSDDMESLKAAAQSILGGGQMPFQEGQPNSETQQQPDAANMFNPDMLSPEMLLKISSMMSMFNKKDSRSDLINALKPHLSAEHRKKADEAMQFLKLMDLLPMLQKTMEDQSQ